MKVDLRDPALTKEDAIRCLYGQKMSINQVSASLGLSPSEVYWVMVSRGIERRNRSEGVNLRKHDISRRRVKFDETVFDEIGRKEAYYLGLLFADGCVCASTGGRHTVSFSSSDFELADKLRRFLRSSSEVHSTSKKNGVQYHVSHSSRHLFKRLVSLGCVERKSRILRKPKIAQQYWMPFLLGFFDGDGSISRNRSINSWKVAFGCASRDFFGWLLQILNNMYLAYSVEKRSTKNGEFFIACLCGLSGRVLLQSMYRSIEDVAEPLQRKKKQFEKLVRVKRLKSPNLFGWERDYLADFSFNNKECCLAIMQDFRNYGWKRSLRHVSQLRKKIGYVPTKVAGKRVGQLP